MKSFLTIRGNLLLINVVVVGLILWLAVSFLYIAASQRSEAVLLQSSMSTEKAISQASEALARERHNFSQYQISLNLDSAVQREKMVSVLLDSDTNLDTITAQVESLVVQSGFIEKIPSTQSSVRELLATLDQHRKQLVVQRGRALMQESTQGKERVSLIFTSLYQAQARIQEDLVNLAKSLKYLPDFSAASIETYYTLLNEILVVNVDLARKNIAMRGILDENDSTQFVSGIQLAVLNENIEQRMADMIRLAQASEKSTQLYPVALAVQQFYLNQYRQQVRNVELMTMPNSHVLVTHTQWLNVTSKLTRLICDLADKTHESIDLLATQSTDRATRNLIIDAFLVFLCFAITLASVMINRRVKRLAYHDSLTQLANRMNFESSLKNLSISGSQSHAVIFFDLDGFKSINDNYGHSTGDQLLIEVAARLQKNCRPSDLLARLGGDEFAVLIHDAKSGAAVEALALSMVDEIERVIDIRDLNLKVGASAGISLAPEDCEGGVELLRNADIAMYHTKSNKLSKVFRFNKSIAAIYQQRLILEQDLKKGLENDEFQLVYQPKVCTSTGQVKSVEALLRWLHPERGLVSPVQFIPVAEETGLMGQIGYWALNEACRELSLLQNSTQPGLQVAVNISPQQFGDEHFVERVCSAVKKHELTYASLSLEVTESIVMTDVQRVIQMLRTLQEFGIDIAVDDFGTGYSSLQYLQELPLNTLKIDRAFITALDDSGPDCSVANLIVQLAALFNLETVAEGVETLEQEEKVRALGVHHIQGYLYSKPVSAKELPAVISAISDQYRASRNDINSRAA